LTASLMSLVAMAPSYATVALILLVVGLSSAGLHAVVPAFAGRLSGSKLGRGMSFWMVGGEVGRTLGPIVVVGVIGVAGLKGLPWLILPGLVGAAVIMVLYGRNKDADRVEVTSRAAWWKAIGGMKAVMAPLVGFVFLRAFMNVAVTTYLPTFMTDEGAELWLAGIALSVLEAAGVVGAFTGGSISDRLGRKTVLGLSIVLSPLCLFGFLSVSGWWQMPFLLALGFVLLSTTPVVMALVQESYPENRTLANGLYMAISFVLRSVVVVIVGQVGDAYGLRTALYLSAVIMFVALPLLWFLPETNRAKTA
jgi:MFS transporter, FSR family, fosmidomycin resistance protein